MPSPLDDGIHIVATLVRQDGNTAWAWNDRPRARAAASDLEQRYGLYRVGPADRTAHRRPGAAELNKTRRTGHREVPRDRLRREVRAAAAAAPGEQDCLNKLRRAGLLVRLRESTVTPGEITGYAVGLPGHHTAAGQPVWYGRDARHAARQLRELTRARPASGGRVPSTALPTDKRSRYIAYRHPAAGAMTGTPTDGRQHRDGARSGLIGGARVHHPGARRASAHRTLTAADAR
jgi:hypothetical protein